MTRQVLPAKAVGDTKDFPVDFISQLSEGEEIDTCDVTISVYCGSDLTPAAMLAADPRISGTQVIQRLTEGTRGVIYILTYTAVTDLLQIIKIKAYLAVIDPDADVPDTECCTRIGNASSINGKDFVITFAENPINEYRHGLPLFVIFDDNQTALEPTLNPDSLGAKEIFLTENTDLNVYEILEDDVLHLVFDEDKDGWILMNKIATQWIAFKSLNSDDALAVEELFNMPGLPQATILAVRAGLDTAASVAKPTFTFTVSGSALLTTALTIDIGETGSYSASVPAVIDASRREQAAGWQLTGNCTVAGTGATGWWCGLKVRFRE